MREARIFTMTVLVTAALASAARAGTMTLVVDGEPAVKPQVSKAALAWLDVEGWPVGPHGLDGGAQQKLAGCLLGNNDESCVVPITKQAGTDRLLFVEASIDQPTEGSGTVVLTGWLLTREGHFLATERQYCERCNGDGITKSTGDLLILLSKTAAVKLGTTLLRVHSVPTGARVMIDNEAVGVTDLEYATYPGAHVVSVDKPGFEIAVRNVNAQEDAATAVDVKMVAIKDAPKVGGGGTVHHGRGVLPWLLMGAGVAVAAGGGVLWSMNESVGGADRQGAYLHTRVPAIVAFGAGAALFGGGLYLYVSRGHSDTETGPTVVGLGGSF